MERIHGRGLLAANSKNRLFDEFVAIMRRYPYSREEQVMFWERWWKGLIKFKNQKHNIPAPTPIQRGDLILYQLHKTDARGVFAGRLVDCCMEPGSCGHPCAWHGHESPDGAFWVVERAGHIVAVAWVWRFDSSLVIDSIEIAKKTNRSVLLSRHGSINPLFVRAARSVLGKMGIKRVYAGDKDGKKWPSPYEKRPFPSPAMYDNGSEICDESVWVHRVASL